MEKDKSRKHRPCSVSVSCKYPSSLCTYCQSQLDATPLITSFQRLDLSEGDSWINSPPHQPNKLTSQTQFSPSNAPGGDVQEDSTKWSDYQNCDLICGASLGSDEDSWLSSQVEQEKKWSCPVCTYDNWPRGGKCVMCLTPKPTSALLPCDGTEHVRHDDRSDWNYVKDICLPTSIQQTNTTPPLTNRCMETNGLERLWLDACHAVVDGDSPVVEAYLSGGGNPSRQLTEQDVVMLDRPSAFEVGLTLIHLALRFQQENLLSRLLSQLEVDGSPTVAKRVPSAASPDLARAIRLHIMNQLRERNPNFPCHVLSEVATFTLPSEIDDYSVDVQESVFDDVLDRDVQKELEEGQIINWSPHVVDFLNSRLYALWNRSSGDCLLDSVLQATWGVFDQDNGLRQALSASLHQCSSTFYERWKETEKLNARLLHFTVNESQCVKDWTKLMAIARKPGSSLEQLHIFVLAHILRRPILIYGVKIVKSFRGETLGYAHYEGVYLPFFWEPPFCYKSPICLGYTRGHFSALVTIDPECDPMSNSTPHAPPLPHVTQRCTYLPLVTADGHLLPIHFLSQSDLGKEDVVMTTWLDVRYTVNGLMVAAQYIQTPSLLVAQMAEEWLNHYRPLRGIGRGSNHPSPPAPSCSSDGDSDNE